MVETVGVRGELYCPSQRDSGELRRCPALLSLVCLSCSTSTSTTTTSCAGSLTVVLTSVLRLLLTSFAANVTASVWTALGSGCLSPSSRVSPPAGRPARRSQRGWPRRTWRGKRGRGGDTQRMGQIQTAVWIGTLELVMKSLAREDTAAPSSKTMETTSLAWDVTRPKNTEMTLIMPGGDERGTSAANTAISYICNYD